MSVVYEKSVNYVAIFDDDDATTTRTKTTTTTARPHPIDVPSGERRREKESHVDANVIIVREKSRRLAAVVQSNHAIAFRSQDFYPSW